MRSTSVSPSHALTSHSSGGRSGRIPASDKASSARSTSSRLDHEVEIVARLRASAGPAREAAAEQERDAGLQQRGGRPLQRMLDVGERLLVYGHRPVGTRHEG